jgi:Skp family chaperone for outer membrane proteins
MKNHTSLFALIIALMTAAFVVYEKTTTMSGKIAFVRMDKLVNEFKGMKEATAFYAAKLENWSRVSDSLKNELTESLNVLKKDSLRASLHNLAKSKKTFEIKRQRYIQFVRETEETAREDNEKLTTGVLTQLQDYVGKYAQSQHLDAVLFHNPDQLLGYNVERIDVTDAVLNYANEHYQSSK